MVITKTPFRMSFFGGGTDMEEFFREHGGAVLSSTFDKHCYVSVRHLPRFFEHRSQISYSRIERVRGTDEIEHPLVREGMRYLDMHDLVVTYDADLPARTGLGTSSSFAVGMLNAFYALKGKYAGGRRLADDAIYLERVACHEAGGWQDQIAAAFGGLNRIDFSGGGYTVSPVVISPERKGRLRESLMLFFTGFSRHSAMVQEDTMANIRGNTGLLMEMKCLVDEAERVLVDRGAPLDELGRMLDHAWRLKRRTGARVSTDGIDACYRRAMDAGALGGKLLGAGGGGFLLFYVPEGRRGRVKAALDGLLHVPFEFEDSGTEVIYYAPEEYHPAERGWGA